MTLGIHSHEALLEFIDEGGRICAVRDDDTIHDVTQLVYAAITNRQPRGVLDRHIDDPAEGYR